MILEQLAKMVADVRALQKLYFRKKANLSECKEAEKELDAAVEAILHQKPPDLFEGAE